MAARDLASAPVLGAAEMALAKAAVSAPLPSRPAGSMITLTGFIWLSALRRSHRTHQTHQHVLHFRLVQGADGREVILHSLAWTPTALVYMGRKGSISHRAQPLIPRLVHLLDIQYQALIHHEVLAHACMRLEHPAALRGPLALFEVGQGLVGLILEGDLEVVK